MAAQKHGLGKMSMVLENQTAPGEVLVTSAEAVQMKMISEN